MKKTFLTTSIVHSITLLIFVCLLSVPFVLNAQGLTSFVPDECYNAPVWNKETGQVSVKCGWDQLMQMGQTIIRNAVYLAVMAATLAIVYVGYLLMTSGDNEGNRKKAKEIMGKVFTGIFYTMAAWLLVATILRFLGVDDAYSLLR